MKRKACIYKQFILAGALLTSSSSALFAQEDSPAHVGIVYPLSTHGTKAAHYANTISLHTLAGLSGGEKAFALYGAAGIVKGNVTGFQAAGIVNRVTGNLNGIQLAGALNLTGTSTNGLQFAGILNQSKGTTRAQLAGAINSAAYTNGMQAAGLSNISQEVKGIQLAGVLNTANDVQGAQLSGVVNKAKKVKGIQLAVLNIADSSDYPIGLVNLVKNGEMSIGAGTDEDLSTFVTFRSGGRVLYGILGTGFNPQYGRIRYGAEGGIGAKLITNENFRLAAEISSITLTDFDGNYFNKNGLRILPSIKIAKNIYLYGGPSINYINTDNADGKKLVKLKIWDKQRTDDYQAFNVGFTGGLQLVL